MYSAASHAKHLAGEFLDDVDEMQRASRAADLRAMSHFEQASAYQAPPHRARYARRSRGVSMAPGHYAYPHHRRAVSVAPIGRPTPAHYNHYMNEPISNQQYMPSDFYHHRIPYSGVMHRNYLHPTAMNGVSSEISSERRRIDRKLDNLLDYKLPPAEYYLGIRSSLRSVLDKMDSHRSLLDRYSAIDMNENSSSVQDRIASKCYELGGQSRATDRLA